jgi:hypothetical protein
MHTKRPIRFLGFHGRIKVYGIADPRPELVAAAREAIDDHLPSDIGFAIAHDAADGCYVLLDWFANQHEIHQRMLSGPDPSVLGDHEEPAIGCVWELAVTDHERRAWLRHVLEHGDLAAYVADTFEGDV